MRLCFRGGMKTKTYVGFSTSFSLGGEASYENSLASAIRNRMARDILRNREVAVRRSIVRRFWTDERIYILEIELKKLMPSIERLFIEEGCCFYYRTSKSPYKNYLCMASDNMTDSIERLSSMILTHSPPYFG